jgi:acetoacetyl-CoA synthetase
MTSVKLPESRMNPKQMEDTTPLWTPSNPESTQMFLFKQAVEGRYNVTLSDYHALHQWSIKNTSLFWQEIWDYTGIVASTSPHSVQYILSLHHQPAR